MRNFLNLSKLAITFLLAAGCTSRHWLATRSDNNMLSEPSGSFSPSADKSNESERFNLGCAKPGSAKGKLSLDSRLKKDQKFVVINYHSFFYQKSLEKSVLLVKSTTDNKIEFAVDGGSTLSVESAMSHDGQTSEINTTLNEKTKSLSQYEVDDVKSPTNCFLETSKLKSDKDMIEGANVSEGVYAFHAEYPKMGLQIRATRLSLETKGTIHCKKDGEMAAVGKGTLTWVEYHSNDIPSPTGITSCGGTKIFESRKFTLGNGQVLEQFRQEIIDGPVLQ